MSQTLTIEVSDESFEQNIALSCGCTCPGVSWPTQGGHCWRVVKTTFPGGTRPTQSVIVPAGGSKEVTLLWNCKWLMSGPDCATSVTVDDVHSTTLLDAAGNNMISAAMVTYRARAVITVTEDRGAILGRTSIGVGMINAVNQISTPMDYLLNGGRPF